MFGCTKHLQPREDSCGAIILTGNIYSTCSNERLSKSKQLELYMLFTLSLSLRQLLLFTTVFYNRVFQNNI